MLDSKYLYKELFVIVDKIDPSLDIADIAFVKDFADLLTYVNKINIAGKKTMENTSIYHGTLIPAKFVHHKINDLTELHLLVVTEVDFETLEESKYYSIKGSFEEVNPFLSLQHVTEFVSKSFIQNHCDISDMFFFLGYKMELVDFTDLDDTVDEAETVAGSKIGEKTKEILDLIEKAEMAICQDITLGHNNMKHYSKILPLMGNCLAVGC